ncbi:hypothetical protein [Micromonospora sp. NBRC 101691]|uniref:hypothetical protein n=1 Tax=Micromonospora sp. NBRC 101691 TaxID=3032198 RepID=UPI00249FD5A4|nr:hypothetical protein [Micromonospora sp. NBRC 101691]GLY25527.1 hypothetical protein Misp04_52580 [Micromonospora sp. NBRC 101691]
MSIEIPDPVPVEIVARCAPTDPPDDTVPLTPKEELDLACTIAASFQQNIQHADSKGSMLAVLASGVVTLVVTQADQVRDGLTGARPVAVAFVVTLVVLVAALVTTGLHLAAALRPRITPPGPANRFAFPAVAGRDTWSSDIRVGDLRTEAWALNRLLADIALAKHQHIVGAIRGVALLVVACLTILVLGVVTG